MSTSGGDPWPFGILAGAESRALKLLKATRERQEEEVRQEVRAKIADRLRAEAHAIRAGRGAGILTSTQLEDISVLVRGGAFE